MTIPTNTPSKPFLPEDDLLWRQLKSIPAFRGVLRAIEARFYFAVDLPGPTLDLGCGDGHFAQLTFDRKIDVGIDPWWNPLKKSYRAQAYDVLLQGMGDKMPFPDKSFASAFSNSVLEHIPDIQPVLNETGRVLQQNGRFLITMPSQFFTQELGGAQWFEKMGMDGMADRYRKFFNGIARHEHTDGPDVWAARLAQAGFAIERWQYYFSTEALHALEIGHVQGMPSAIMHALTGTWIVAPWESSLSPTEKWLRPFYDEEASAEQGTCILIVAKKVADGPIPVELPPARPFTIAELETAVAAKLHPTSPATEDSTPPVPVLAPPVEENRPVQAAPHPTPAKKKSNFDLISASLIGLTVLLAVIGQQTISQNPYAPLSGVRWFLLNFVALFLLAWRTEIISFGTLNWKRPSVSLKAIPRQRWFYLLSFVIIIFAVRQANTWPAWLTLLLWVSGIFLAAYSLYEKSTSIPESNAEKTPRKFLLLAGIILFAAALLIRLIGLTEHPWILNGWESSLGLEVQNIASGAYRNPFSTGWLTVPTLPLFLMAIPVRLFGSTAASIRLLSPFVGALTVLVTFLIGTRLWRLEVGLIAGIFLTGSYIHIHYSRLGIPAIWDGLLMLLALGLLSIAWQESKRRTTSNRPIWLWAGIAVGLTAYAYTPSHVMPLILILFLLSAILFQRQTVAAQFRNMLAALALALVVALPQFMHYNNNPGLFMERFHEISIFSDQTNWLSQEMTFTGSSAATVLWQQTQKALLTFNISQDSSPAFGNDAALLSGGLTLLFVLGVMMAILRFRRQKYGMALLWLAVPLLWGGVLLVQGPSSDRLLGLLPLVCLLAAEALVEIGEWVFALYKSDESTAEKSKQLLLPVLLIIAAIIALNEILFYFGPYRQSHTFADRNTEIAFEVAEYLNTLEGDSTTAYFHGAPNMYISFPTIPYLAHEFTANKNLFDVADGEETAVMPTPIMPSLAFIFLPERANELEAIEAEYPGGVQQTVPGFHANPLFYTYEVTP